MNICSKGNYPLLKLQNQYAGRNSDSIGKVNNVNNDAALFWSIYYAMDFIM